MIPYFTLPNLPLPFGLKIDIFGILSTAGVVAGALLATRAARKYAPGDDEPLRGVVTWAVSLGLVGGHLLHLFGYHPEQLVAEQRQMWPVLGAVAGAGALGFAASALAARFPAARAKLESYHEELVLSAALWGALLVQVTAQTLMASAAPLREPTDPWVVLRVWEGLSSMGGVLGALAGIFIYFRRIKEPVSPYLDALALGAAPGWAVARIGCFLVHDHPGVRTTFPLAVDFPVAGFGGPRHDLGLYDFFALVAISGLLYGLARLKPKQGALMGVLAMTYSVSRFLLDFLRASDLSFVDRRYAGLTPAQYVVVGLFGVGLWLVVRRPPVVVDRTR